MISPTKSTAANFCLLIVNNPEFLCLFFLLLLSNSMHSHVEQHSLHSDGFPEGLVNIGPAYYENSELIGAYLVPKHYLTCNLGNFSHTLWPESGSDQLEYWAQTLLNASIEAQYDGPLTLRTNLCSAATSAMINGIAPMDIIRVIGPSFAHFLGQVVGQLATSTRKISFTLRAVAPSPSLPEYQSGSHAVMHGFIWHVTAGIFFHTSAELYTLLQVELCPFDGSSPVYFYHCLHGAGHGVLLGTSSQGTGHLLNYSACAEVSHRLIPIDFNTLTRAASICGNGNKDIMHGCLGGVYHTFFDHFRIVKSLPTPVNWMSPCNAVPLAANCFVYLFQSPSWNTHGNGPSPIWKAHTDRLSSSCLRMSMLCEAHVRACIFGLSQQLFFAYDFVLKLMNKGYQFPDALRVCQSRIRSHQLRRFCSVVGKELIAANGARGTLTSWCRRFSLAEDRNTSFHRTLVCISSAMFRWGHARVSTEYGYVASHEVARFCQQLLEDESWPATHSDYAFHICTWRALYSRKAKTSWRDFEYFGARLL